MTYKGFEIRGLRKLYFGLISAGVIKACSPIASKITE
jgi:hypothetical protein